MRGWLATRTETTPDALALIIGQQRWSFRLLYQLVRRYTQLLVEAGVEPGDRVAVLTPSGLPYVCLVYALADLGAVLVPLNRRLTWPELDRQLEVAGCRICIYQESAGGKPSWPTHSGRQYVDLDSRPLPAHGWERSAQALWPQERVQAIVFTSGSSGAPKGAMLTFDNHFWSSIASSFRLGLHTDDRWLSCLPLYHVGGLAVLFRSCLYGTAVILHDGFDIAAISRSLDHDRATLVSLVPTMLYRLLQWREAWPDTLRLVLLGGAAASAELLAAAQTLCVPVATTYGLTEAASQVATMLPEEVRAKPGSVGKPLMFTHVRIADEQGHDLPAGALGEVVVSGPTVMAGYCNNPAASEAALRGGELFTGDMGYLDEAGDLWLVQRRSDLIVSGGENVFPGEVEEILRRHPAVLDACVVPAPHPEWGQQVAAMAAIRPESSVTAAELADFCRHHLGGYKRPRRFLLVSELPQTASGKVDRQAVRRAFENKPAS